MNRDTYNGSRRRLWEHLAHFYWQLPFVLKSALWLLMVAGAWYCAELVLGHRLYLIDVTSLSTVTDSAMVQAAWFQAVGSVAAIVAAIWIAQRQSIELGRRDEDERRRRALIEGGVLVSLFHGVALEARAKGEWMLQLAYTGNTDELSRVLATDTKRFSFASIDLLQPHYSATAWLTTSVGMNIAIAMSFLLPYNATLRDVVTRRADSEEDLRRLFFDLARRAATAQQVAFNALQVLHNHPSSSQEMLDVAGKLDWYDVGDIEFDRAPLDKDFDTRF